MLEQGRIKIKRGLRLKPTVAGRPSLPVNSLPRHALDVYVPENLDVVALPGTYKLLAAHALVRGTRNGYRSHVSEIEIEGEPGLTGPAYHLTIRHAPLEEELMYDGPEFNERDLLPLFITLWRMERTHESTGYQLSGVLTSEDKFLRTESGGISANQVEFREFIDGTSANASREGARIWLRLLQHWRSEGLL